MELGAQTYYIDSRYNGQPASGMGIQLAPGQLVTDVAFVHLDLPPDLTQGNENIAPMATHVISAPHAMITQR